MKNIKINNLFAFIASALVTFFVTFIVVVLNSYIFLDPIADKIVKERFNAGQIALKETMGHQLLPIDIEWPLASIVFFVFAMSVYWFIYGLVVKKKLPNYPKLLMFLLPIFFGAFVQEFYFIPLYILVCFLGVKAAS